MPDRSELTPGDQELSRALSALTPRAASGNAQGVAMAHLQLVARRRVRRWQVATGVLSVAFVAALMPWQGASPIESNTLPVPRVAVDVESRTPTPARPVPRLASPRGTSPAFATTLVHRKTVSSDYLDLRREVLDRGVSWLTIRSPMRDDDDSTPVEDVTVAGWRSRLVAPNRLNRPNRTLEGTS